MIKVIIVEDELNSREMVKNLLISHFNKIKIVAEAGNVKNSIEEIQKHQPDLLLLDIDLPDGTSFDILKQIDYKKYKVVFITAHQEYAIQAIKFSAFDYILKPFQPAELIKTIEKVLEEKISEDYELKFQAIFSNFSGSLPGLKKIVLKTSDKIHIVDVKEILRCESDNTYTTFHLNTGKKIIVSKSIKKFEELLSGHSFMRVHQSHLINLNYIAYFDKQEGGAVVMTDKSHIPISNQKKSILFDYLDSL